MRKDNTGFCQKKVPDTIKIDDKKLRKRFNQHFLNDLEVVER